MLHVYWVTDAGEIYSLSIKIWYCMTRHISILYRILPIQLEALYAGSVSSSVQARVDQAKAF